MNLEHDDDFFRQEAAAIGLEYADYRRWNGRRATVMSLVVVAPTVEPLSLVGLTLDRLAEHVFPNRRALLTRDGTPVFCEGHIGQVYAERGFGKTWFLQTLALVAAAGSEALGFRTAEPCRVLYVDGEMASHEIKERLALLCERLYIPQTAALTVVAADWQEQFLPRLDTVAGQAAVEPFVEAADLVMRDGETRRTGLSGALGDWRGVDLLGSFAHTRFAANAWLRDRRFAATMGRLGL